MQPTTEKCGSLPPSDPPLRVSIEAPAPSPRTGGDRIRLPPNRVLALRMPNWLRLPLLLLLAHVLLGTETTLALQPTASDPGAVRGVVQSAETNEALPGANVAVRRTTDSTLVDGTTTDSTGHFVVSDLSTGRYRVTVRFVGYTPRSRTVRLTAETPTRTLSPFELRDATAQMDEATVSADRPAATIRGSKTIYSTEQMQVALAGKSSVDLLETLPSVRVDKRGRGAAIQLRGNSSVSVRINGDPVPMSGQALLRRLRSLPAGRIEKIEVNTNPSARQEAEGTAGIINVVLSGQERQGWNGGVSLSAGSALSEPLPRVRGSGHLGYKQNGWSVFGSYGYSRFENEVSVVQRRDTRGTPSRPLLRDSTTIGFERGGHNLTAEAKYDPGSGTTVSLATTAGWQAPSFQRDVTGADWNGGEPIPYRRRTSSSDPQREFQGDLSAEHKFGDGHTLSADARYETEQSEANVQEEIASGAGERRQQMKTDDERTASLSLDYERPMGSWRLETGYKGTLRNLEQQYRLFRLDRASGRFSDSPARSGILDYDEQVQAAYAVLQREIGPVSAELGTRLEHTWVTVGRRGETPSENQYLNIFPSGTLTYNSGGGRRISLSYSNRLDRPSITQLSAFGRTFSLSDPRLQWVGNPSLDPEQSHNVELTVMQRVGPATVTLSPYVRRRTDAIRMARTVRSDSVTVQSPKNFDSGTALGTELTASVSAGALKANISGNLYRQEASGATLSRLEFETVAASGRVSLTWSLRPDLQVQLFQYYRSSRQTSRGRTDPFLRTSVSAEKTFWNGDATLGLEIRDPFDNSQFELGAQTRRYRERTTRNWTGRSVSLSFSYQFGSADPKERPSAGGRGGGGPMG